MHECWCQTSKHLSHNSTIATQQLPKKRPISSAHPEPFPCCYRTAHCRQQLPTGPRGEDEGLASKRGFEKQIPDALLGRGTSMNPWEMWVGWLLCWPFPFIIKIFCFFSPPGCRFSWTGPWGVVQLVLSIEGLGQVQQHLAFV